MKNISISITDEQAETLKRRQAASGVPVSLQIRRVLELENHLRSAAHLAEDNSDFMDVNSIVRQCLERYVPGLCKHTALAAVQEVSA